MNTYMGRLLRHGIGASATVSALVVFAAGCGGSAAPSTGPSTAVSGAGASATASTTPTTAASAATSTAPLSSSFPGTLLGLPQITGATANQFSSAIVGPMSAAGFLVHPQVAIYGGQNNGMVVVRSGLSAAAKKYGGKPTAAAMRTGFLVMGATGVQTFPPGASEPSLVCGKLSRSGLGVIFCEHISQAGITLTMFFNGLASGVSDAASKTNQILSTLGA